MNIDFKHRQSVHCESGVTTGLLGFQGMSFSEQMIFGIGSGLFFGYFPFIKINSIMVTTFRNQPGAIFKKTVNRLGVPHQVRTYKNSARAMDDLDRLLDKGIPVGLQTSLFWLPYLLPRLRNHFNAHNIIVYGKKGDDYLVSEPLMDEPVTCGRADLIRARFAKGGMDPNGKMYWLTGKPDKEPDLKNAVLQGLKETCFLMLKVPVPLLGVGGIRHFAKDIRRWPGRMNPELVKLNLHQFILMQEVVGSGGAGFRFMFAAFLKEAADILNMPELNEISDGMIKAGDLWREGALLITQYYRDRVQEKEFFEKIPRFISECADSEEEQMKKLYAAIRKKRG
jgi:hypothetical protein